MEIMKKILVAIILLFFSLFANAKKISVQMDSSKSSVTLVIDGKIYNTEQLIPAVYVDSIEIEELTKLDEMKSHGFMVNGTKKQLGDRTASFSIGKYSWKVDFTLQPCNKIEILRKDTVCATFYVELSSAELDKLVKLSLSPSSDICHHFLNDSIKEFTLNISNKKNLELKDLEIHVDGKKLKSAPEISTDRILYKIDPVELKEDTTRVYIVFSTLYSKGEHKKEIGKVVKVKGKEDGILKYIVLVLGFIFVLLLLLWGLIKLKWRIQGTRFCSKKRVFRVLCSTPKIGDRANREGVFVTKDNLVYKLTRNKRFGKITVKSIFTRIYYQNNQYFDVDINLESSFVGPRGWYELADGKKICVTKGATATPDGEYIMNNGYVFQVRSGRIDSVIFRICNKDKQYFDIVLTGDKPQEGDEIIGERNRKIELGDGTVYEVVNGKIAKIIKPSNQPPVAELIKKLEEANKLIQKYAERPTKEDFDELKKQFIKVEKQNIEYAKELENVNKVIDEAEKRARAEENRRIETKYKRIISEKYVSLEKYDEDVQELKRKKDYAKNEEIKAKKEIELKEGQIKDAKDKIKELESEANLKSEELIREKAAVAKLKEAAMKKNMHYLLQVQETLNEISESFKYVYKDIDNSIIKDGLISPMLKGVSGLSAGVLSWAEDFSVKVAEDSESFFGKDFLTMNELDVKEILAKKFISNIVKSDSFSKFVRLYQLSTVPFIRKQLVEAKMNIDMLNKLYYKVYTLVVDFGYIIVCPRLYEEQYADAKYQWFNSTNLFNVISLPEEEKQAIKAKGAEVIIDVNQIGFESPWTSRKATAVTPDF